MLNIHEIVYLLFKVDLSALSLSISQEMKLLLSLSKIVIRKIFLELRFYFAHGSKPIYRGENFLLTGTSNQIRSQSNCNSFSLTTSATRSFASIRQFRFFGYDLIAIFCRIDEEDRRFEPPL